MPDENQPSALEALQSKVLRDSANGLNAAAVMSYFRNMNRLERNSQRMEAQVDARLKCMYPDTYETPEDDDMSGDIFYGNIITNEEGLRALNREPAEGGETPTKEPPKEKPGTGQPSTGQPGTGQPGRPNTGTPGGIRPAKPNGGRMSLPTAALLAAGILGSGGAIGYGISKMPVPEIPAQEVAEEYYNLRTR